MSDRTKIAIIVAVLVALVPLWNFVAEGAGQVFHPKKTQHEELEETQPKIKLPVFRGPEGAPVVIRAYLSGSNPCHITSISMLEQLAEEYPDQVRVEVYDKDDPKVAEEADRVKIGCEMGILVNGRGAFNVPGRGVIMLQGPVDSSHDYTMKDLRLIVEREIRAKTGKPPKRNPAAVEHSARDSCLAGPSRTPPKPEPVPASRNDGKPGYKATIGTELAHPPH